MRLGCLMLAVAGCVFAQVQVDSSAKFRDVNFLVGEWIGKGTGQPGQATKGGTTFAFEVQGNVLVRHNYAEYAATKNHPATRHDDLMVIYAQQAGSPLHAIYFDSEDHVINYTARVTIPGTVEFLSDVTPAGRFRLTYVQHGPDELDLKFETAPQSKPDAFQNYIEAVLIRTPRQ